MLAAPNPTDNGESTASVSAWYIWKDLHNLLSSALIASIVCSICGALHEYNWYGVATLSKGCRCVLFFWSMEKFRLNAGLIWFNNSIKEWHKWLGVAGFGLKSSSEDLERMILKMGKQGFINVIKLHKTEHFQYFQVSPTNILFSSVVHYVIP
jgi:hypothetical protein